MELEFKPGPEAEPEILNIAPLRRLKEYAYSFALV